LAFVLLAAACGGGGGTSGGRSPQTGGVTPVAARAVDPTLDLKVGLGADSYVVSGPNANLGANANVTETLVSLSPTFEPRPLLAESWEVRPNAADQSRPTWRFHLRRGVKFQDGQPFNADAVKAGLFDRVAKMRGGATINAGPDSAVVVDEFTIDFTPTVANMRVPEQLVHPSIGAVVAPGTTLESKPVGTGPFRFVDYKSKESLVVERNPDYWGPKAAASKITFKFYPDPSARLLALKSGDVDLAVDVPRPEVAGLKQSGFPVVMSPVGSYQALYVNVHGTLADADMRRAVAEAIDRKALVDGVFEGLATTSQTFVPADALGPHASDVKGVPYDKAAAGALLDKAGWVVGGDGIRHKGAQSLQLNLISGYPSADALRPAPAFLQQELRKVGVDVKITEVQDEKSFNDAMKDPKNDLFLEQGSQNDANPAFLPAQLLYTGKEATTETRTVAAVGAPFDDVLAPVFREPNHDVLQGIVAKAMHVVVDEQVSLIPLAGIPRLYAMNDKVSGLTPHPALLNLRWADVGLSSR
jgi:peptide/nickel transport system substrate-binding protein